MDFLTALTWFCTILTRNEKKSSLTGKIKFFLIIKVSTASGLYCCTCIYGFAILPKSFSPTALGHCDTTGSHYLSPFLSFSRPPPLDPSFLFFSAEPAKVLIAHLDLLQGSAFNIYFLRLIPSAYTRGNNGSL